MTTQLPMWIQIPIVGVFFLAVVVFLWGWWKLVLKDLFHRKGDPDRQVISDIRQILSAPQSLRRAEDEDIENTENDQ